MLETSFNTLHHNAKQPNCNLKGPSPFAIGIGPNSTLTPKILIPSNHHLFCRCCCSTTCCRRTSASSPLLLLCCLPLLLLRIFTATPMPRLQTTLKLPSATPLYLYTKTPLQPLHCPPLHQRLHSPSTAFRLPATPLSTRWKALPGATQQ